MATMVLVALLAGALPLPAGAAEPPAAKAQSRKRDAPPVADPKEPTSCKRPPPGKKVLKLDLKADSEVVDLISWYSMVSCTPIMLSSGVSVAGKKVTVLSPNPMSLEEAHSLFL